MLEIQLPGIRGMHSTTPESYRVWQESQSLQRSFSTEALAHLFDTHWLCESKHIQPKLSREYSVEKLAGGVERTGRVVPSQHAQRQRHDEKPIKEVDKPHREPDKPRQVFSKPNTSGAGKAQDIEQRSREFVKINSTEVKEAASRDEKVSSEERLFSKAASAARLGLLSGNCVKSQRSTSASDSSSDRKDEATSTALSARECNPGADAPVLWGSLNMITQRNRMHRSEGESGKSLMQKWLGVAESAETRAEEATQPSRQEALLRKGRDQYLRRLKVWETEESMPNLKLGSSSRLQLQQWSIRLKSPQNALPRTSDQTSGIPERTSETPDRTSGAPDRTSGPPDRTSGTPDRTSDKTASLDHLIAQVEGSAKPLRRQVSWADQSGGVLALDETGVPVNATPEEESKLARRSSVKKLERKGRREARAKARAEAIMAMAVERSAMVKSVAEIRAFGGLSVGSSQFQSRRGNQDPTINHQEGPAMEQQEVVMAEAVQELKQLEAHPEAAKREGSLSESSSQGAPAPYTGSGRLAQFWLQS